MRIHRVAAAALVACGVACAAACGIGSRSEALPPQLLHVWRTEAPGYRDRSFELRPGWVVFGTSRYTNVIHPIESVQTKRSGSSTIVTIGYRVDDGAVLELRLEWTPGAPDLLRIGHRHDLWVPEENATWLKENAS